MASRKAAPVVKTGSNIPIAWQSTGCNYQTIFPELSWRRPGKDSHNLLMAELEAPSTSLCLVPIKLRDIPALIKADLALPLTNVIPAHELKGYFPPVLDACTSKGILYAIPEDFTPYVLVARRDVLKKYSFSSPSTWKELEQQAKKLANEQKEPVIAPLGGTHFSLMSFISALLGSNGLTSSQSWEDVSVNTNIYAESYDWIQRLVENNLMDLMSLDPGNYRTDDFFNQGKWVYRFGWLNELKAEPPAFWKSVYLLPFPSGPSGKKPVTLMHGHAWIIPSKSIAAEMGKKALKCLASKEIVLKVEGEAGGGYPFHAREDVWKHPKILSKQPAYRYASTLTHDRVFSAHHVSKQLGLLGRNFIPSLQMNESSHGWLSKISRQVGNDVHQIVKQAVSYIKGHLKENLTINDVAKALGKSRRHLDRLFLQEMHVSAADYLNNLRMEQAHKLLTTTSLSVKEVASQTGFDYFRAFSRAFKRHWGELPSVVQSKATKPSK
jgi:AraC-like DNA-binding protein